MNFDDLISRVKECEKKTVAVAAAEDDAVLEAVNAAREQGIADAILVGDEAKIREIAAELKIDLTGWRIINEPDKVQASLKAVKLAHDGEADMYMKGLLDTKTFLKSILDKEVGLRTGKTLSHVAVFQVEGIEQLLFLTDVAFVTYPSLRTRSTSLRTPSPWPMPAASPAPRSRPWPPLRWSTPRCPAPSMPTSCAR